jgi:hypothetical protein
MKKFYSFDKFSLVIENECIFVVSRQGMSIHSQRKLENREKETEDIPNPGMR